MSATVLVGAAQALTLSDGPKNRSRAGAAQAELGVRHDLSVVMEGGRITWIGAEGDRPALPGASEVDCRGKALLPALVDSHTHLVWGGDRKDELEQRLGGADYEHIFAAGGGILSSVRQTRALSDDELLAESAGRISRQTRRRNSARPSGPPRSSTGSAWAARQVVRTRAPVSCARRLAIRSWRSSVVRSRP